ncbi:MAG: ECF transporter S component [Clostridia bacterium]|nr:ECF transporter S component [Clostridia bacterium]MDR3645229.1 ECF transporter S component [Clostridia bacterium]
MKSKTLKITLLALFCALSAVGANIKIAGSIAFDSMPAFLAAMLLGGPEGAVVGALGHLLSAVLSGFPLTLPLHLCIAAEMALICLVTGLLIRRGRWPVWLGAVLAFVLNAFVSPAILLVWPGMGWGACAALLLPLTLASAANVTLAAILAYALKKPLALLNRRLL